MEKKGKSAGSKVIRFVLAIVLGELMTTTCSDD